MKNEEERKAEFEPITFTITCTMRRRWAVEFIGMLKYMQKLGSWGSSRTVSFFADGDGDFRPKFIIEPEIPNPSEGREKIPNSGDRFWDAG